MLLNTFLVVDKLFLTDCVSVIGQYTSCSQHLLLAGFEELDQYKRTLAKVCQKFTCTGGGEGGIYMVNFLIRGFRFADCLILYIDYIEYHQYLKQRLCKGTKLFYKCSIKFTYMYQATIHFLRHIERMQIVRQS